MDDLQPIKIFLTFVTYFGSDFYPAPTALYERESSHQSSTRVDLAHFKIGGTFDLPTLEKPTLSPPLSHPEAAELPPHFPTGQFDMGELKIKDFLPNLI